MVEVKKDGFNFGFNEDACKDCEGNCCIGESGYIWISPQEIVKIANFLSMDEEEFKREYLLKIGYKFSIKEKSFKDGFACVFFDENRGGCGIYSVRPTQCRTFPFWDYFKFNLEELERECPGVIV